MRVTLGGQMCYNNRNHDRIILVAIPAKRVSLHWPRTRTFDIRGFSMHLFSELNDSPLLMKRSSAQRYGFAFLLVALATLLTLTIPTVRNDTPFVLLFVAVTLSAWYGGLRPGLFALCLATVISAFWVAGPNPALFVTNLDEAIKLGRF